MGITFPDKDVSIVLHSVQRHTCSFWSEHVSSRAKENACITCIHTFVQSTFVREVETTLYLYHWCLDVKIWHATSHASISVLYNRYSTTTISFCVVQSYTKLFTSRPGNNGVVSQPSPPCRNALNMHKESHQSLILSLIWYQVDKADKTIYLPPLRLDMVGKFAKWDSDRDRSFSKKRHHIWSWWTGILYPDQCVRLPYKYWLLVYLRYCLLCQKSQFMLL